MSQSWSYCIRNIKENAYCAQQANCCSVDQRLNCSAHYWHVCFALGFLFQLLMVLQVMLLHSESRNYLGICTPL